MHACGIPSSCLRRQMSSKRLPPPAFPVDSHSALVDPDEPERGGIIHRIRLQPHAPAFVRVELFSEMGATPVVSSGAFTGSRSGAATAQVALRAGQYIIEPTADVIPGANGAFSLMVYSLCVGISLVPL